MKITDQTTLAELRAYLITLGNPFLTLRKKARADRYRCDQHDSNAEAERRTQELEREIARGKAADAAAATKKKP